MMKQTNAAKTGTLDDVVEAAKDVEAAVEALNKALKVAFDLKIKSVVTKVTQPFGGSYFNAATGTYEAPKPVAPSFKVRQVLDL